MSIDGTLVKDVLLDTGASYTLLGSSTVPLVENYIHEDEQETGGCSIKGCVESGNFVSKVQEYCLGNLCQEDLEVKYPVWDAVGNSYFLNYHVVFDFPSGTLVICED